MTTGLGFLVGTIAWTEDERLKTVALFVFGGLAIANHVRFLLRAQAVRERRAQGPPKDTPRRRVNPLPPRPTPRPDQPDTRREWPDLYPEETPTPARPAPADPFAPDERLIEAVPIMQRAVEIIDADAFAPENIIPGRPGELLRR